MERQSPLVEPLLAPFAALYGGIMAARNAAFDLGFRPSYDVGAPVLSIGNLTAGGTGKTPLTAFLLERLVSRQVRVGIVSRGYGGSEKGPARVPPSGDELSSAARFGDEPTWFARQFSEVPVVIGADRVEASRFLLANERVDLILADDAFQHRRLKRAFDAVVVDATEPEWHYRPLPLGRMREGFASIRRAKAVFITKCNLADDGSVARLRDRITQAIRSDAEGPIVIAMESVIGSFDALGAERSRAPVDDLRGMRLILASGIGRPATFPKLVVASTGGTVIEHFVFKDHHQYSKADLDTIERAATERGAQAIVVTEKDAVKMSAWRPRVPVWVSRLSVKPLPGSIAAMGEFNEAVDRLLL